VIDLKPEPVMTNLAFRAHLKDLRQSVDAALQDCLIRTDWPKSLLAAVEYSLMAGGKRLRPVLVMLANEVCGGRQDDAVSAACAIEMIHTYSLIHDDLPAMDDDDFRRGRPTSHKVFGEALAILAGDCLLTLAFETIAASPGISPAQVVELTKILASAAGGTGMVGGQVLDLEAERGSFLKNEVGGGGSSELPNSGSETSGSADEKSQDLALFTETQATIAPPAADSEKNDSNRSAENRVGELSRIHKMKTGALIAGALELGAVCASLDANSRNQLRHYGHCIGLAFQIADDLLDVTGDQTKLGKKPGRDADLGKLTYPGLLGIECSRLKAEQLVQEACAAVDIFGDRSVWLKDLARFIVERDH